MKLSMEKKKCMVISLCFGSNFLERGRVWSLHHHRDSLPEKSSMWIIAEDFTVLLLTLASAYFRRSWHL